MTMTATYQPKPYKLDKPVTDEEFEKLKEGLDKILQNPALDIPKWNPEAVLRGILKKLPPQQE